MRLNNIVFHTPELLEAHVGASVGEESPVNAPIYITVAAASFPLPFASTRINHNVEWKRHGANDEEWEMHVNVHASRTGRFAFRRILPRLHRSAVDLHFATSSRRFASCHWRNGGFVQDVDSDDESIYEDALETHDE